MFKAISIADFFIQFSKDIQDNSVDNLKINKLLYFAQGNYLSKFGKPLFSDDIEAWDYGPVVPFVYKTFKCCGSNSIDEPFENFDEGTLSTEDLEFLMNVYDCYGKYTGLAPKDFSHMPGTPWSEIYAKKENRVIPLELMKTYFSKHSEMKYDKLDFEKIPVIDRIPSAWDTTEDEVYDGV